MALNILTNDRGQVGIGTLIVFIAMVLVAAIAAGVLINTAGLLQDQAEQTGQETQSEVSDRVIIVGATGNVSESETINKADITVRGAAGSDAIDLERMTIEWVDDDNSATLAYAELDTGSNAKETEHEDVDNHFFTKQIIGENDPVLIEEEDRIELTVALDDDVNVTAGGGGEYDQGAGDTLAPDLDSLDEGERAELTFVTAGGGQTFATLNVPSSLSDENVVNLD